MRVDIRLPIGLLFTIIGVLIAVFGFATIGDETYQHSLGININIWSGIILTLFGISMLFMAIRAQAKEKKEAQSTSP